MQSAPNFGVAEAAETTDVENTEAPATKSAPTVSAHSARVNCLFFMQRAFQLSALRSHSTSKLSSSNSFHTFCRVAYTSFSVYIHPLPSSSRGVPATLYP